MSRIATQLEILEAVKRRIVEEVPPLNEWTVFITDADEPPDGVQNDVVATIWITDGQYDDALHEGGGIHQTVEYAGVAITLWRRSWHDRDGLGSEMLEAESKGLLTLKEKLLKAFSGHDLKDEGGGALLVNYMAPISSESPRRMQHHETGQPVGDVRMVFSTDWLWDIEG